MHFTVVVNPASGKRTAKQALVTLKQRLIDSGCWKEDPAPSVDDRNHTFSVFETLHAGHGFTIASELAMINASRSGELDQSLNLILLGGDGLVHEVINGVLAAESFKSKVLMAVIPCGSGNALATTLGIKDIDDGINRVLAFNFSTSLAIQTVCVNYTNTNITHTEISKPIYSFCVVSWGLHAQIVRQSDWFRFMGNKRFSLAAWLNIMFFKQYWARFSVDASASCKKITTKEDETTPLLQEQIYTAASAFKAADLFEQDTSGFQTVFSSETPFSYFLSTRMRELEPGFCIAPWHSTVASPTVDMVLAPNCGRRETVSLLKGALNKGTHINLPYVEYLKVTNFNLQPLTRSARWKRPWVGFLFGMVAHFLFGIQLERGHDICVDGEMLWLQDGQQIEVCYSEQMSRRFSLCQ